MNTGSDGYSFLTNNFALPIARWQVELFFKWIKQHLRSKVFYGTSENAVKTQIGIAVCDYALIAIVKKRLRLEHSRYTILQTLSISLFKKTPVNSIYIAIFQNGEGERDGNSGGGESAVKVGKNRLFPKILVVII